MIFAHFADVHIGSWRDPNLAGVSTKAFIKGLEICKEKKVDFILIAGDFFNTSLPSIDALKDVTSELKKLADLKIPVYLIAGSHDYSPTGKTMLDVLENAGLCRNVMRGNVIENRLKLEFTLDAKTGAKLVGVVGKKGMLDKAYYENLMLENLEKESGTKIFLFHTMITEMKPKGLELMESTPLSYFPKGFNYYAGGHPHDVQQQDFPGHGLVAYPGPVFPNNIREIEKLKNGGFYLVRIEDDRTHAEWIPLKIHDVETLTVDCNHLEPSQISEKIKNFSTEKKFENTIVTIRLKGKIKTGKIQDINLDRLIEKIKEKGAVSVLKNLTKLTTTEFEDVKVDTSTVEELEKKLINEQSEKMKLEGNDAVRITQELMQVLDTEKGEGETTFDIEKRIKSEIEKILGIEL